MTKFYILTAKKGLRVFHYIFVEESIVKLASSKLRKQGFATNYISYSGNNIALVGKDIKFDVTTIGKED